MMNSPVNQKDNDGVLDFTVGDLSRKISSGGIDCVELMEATLDRIAEVQPKLNPFILLKDRKELLEQARKASIEVSSKQHNEKDRWLLGIPMAVKDLVHASGFPTTLGGIFPPNTTPPEKQSDPHIQRLQSAGAIIIGKTNVPAFGLGSHTVNDVFGVTRNSHHSSRSAGGSSGGAAVAVATKCLGAADGTDMGGSLRNPAGWNLIYSIRPTAGLLAPEEADEAGPLPYPLSTSGPMARCVDDLGYLLETMAGKNKWTYVVDGNEAKQWRVLWLGDWGGAVPVEKGILDLCLGAVNEKFPDDVTVETEFEHDLFPLSELWESWLVIRSYVVARNAKALSPIKSDWSDTRPELQWEIEQGSKVSKVQLDIARSTVSQFSSWLDQSIWSQGYDAIALPSAQVWPFPVEIMYPTEIEGVKMESYHEWMKIMIMVSLGGLPCVTVPAGVGESGLPMGIQLAGPRTGDQNVLELAKRYEKEYHANRQA